MEAISAKLFDAFDLAGNMERAGEAFKGIRGLISALFFLIFTCLALVFGWVAWRYDVYTTHMAIQGATGHLSVFGAPTWIAAGLSLIAHIAAFMPTFIEVASSRLAAFRVAFFSPLFFFCAGFDMITDGPAIWEGWLNFLPGFVSWLAGCGDPSTFAACAPSGFSLLGYGIAHVVWGVLFVPLLLLCSFGSEIIVIISTFLAILTLWETVEGIIDMIRGDGKKTVGRGR
jgi:hypothetical protein